MKYIKKYLKDVIKVEPLGKLTTMDDELYGMSGEMVYIDGKCSDIFISHADYVNWLEEQGENKSITDIPSRNVILAIWELGNDWKELTNGCISTEHGTQLNYIQKHWHESEYYLREKQGKRKPADKVNALYKLDTFEVKDVKDNSLEKFKSLQHISKDFHKTLVDFGYAPNLYYFDRSWHVDWISCEEGDSIKDFTGNTAEEAINEAYNWFHSTFCN